jgi:cobalt-zinc-cadmium resistance protein CzcA
MVLVKKQHKHKNEPLFFRAISYLYRPILKFSLNHKFVILIPVLLFGAISFFIFSKMGSDFVPPLNEGDMSIGFVREPSMGINESVRQQKENDKIIKSFPEVKHTFSRVGVAESATDPMGVNMGDSFIILEKDMSEWPLINGKRRTKETLFEAIKNKIDNEIPDQEMMSTQPIEFRFNEILEGSRADVSLRIFGSDLNKLIILQDEAKEIAEKIEGVSEVELDANTALRKGPFLNIHLMYDKIARYGVEVTEVNHILEAAMSGRTVGSFYEYDWRFPIVVRMAEKYRNNIAQINNIPLGLKEGGTIPINKVTKIEQVEQINNIARNMSKRYAAVAINLGERDTSSFVQEAKENIKEKLKLPAGYNVRWGGQFKNLEKARERLMVIVPITLLIIFILLLKTFGSLKQTLIVYSAIPFAMTGGILSLYMRGINFSVSAAVGFIALTGIAILNSMVMVSFFNQLRDKGSNLHDAVFNGAMIRLRPVIMTAMVASFGFIPMALNTGIGAEVQRPLATVVIGGLITATILTLLVLPMLYLWTDKENSDVNNKRTQTK